MAGDEDLGLMSVLRKARRIALSTLSKASVRSASVQYLGLSLRVPLLYGLGARYLSLKSDWVVERLPRLLALRPGAFVDIGASLGYFLVRLRAYAPERAYYGFEPNPACALYIQQLIRINGFDNARLFAVALSDKQELRAFHARKFGDRTGSLMGMHAAVDDRGYSFDLVTTPGDAFFEALAIDAIGMCKIDVEGAELDVLRGLRATLARYRPLILCELLEQSDSASPEREEKQARHTAVLELLRELDYRVLGVTRQLELVEVTAASQIDKRFERDYLMVHASEADRMRAGWIG